VRPKYITYDGGDALTYVISQKVLRRHLTPSQRAVLALELEEKYAKEPKAGVNQHTKGAIRSRTAAKKARVPSAPPRPSIAITRRGRPVRMHRHCRAPR